MHSTCTQAPPASTTTSTSVDAPAPDFQEQNTALALPELADNINAEHRQAEAAINNGLQHALKAGQLLLAAKSHIEHGQWIPWLKKNFQGSGRTARAYTLLAKRWPAADGKLATRDATLSYRKAVRLLTASKAAPQDEAPLTIEALASEFQAYQEDFNRRWKTHHERAMRSYRRRLDATATVKQVFDVASDPETNSILRERQRLERERHRYLRGLEKLVEGAKRRIAEFETVADTAEGRPAT